MEWLCSQIYLFFHSTEGYPEENWFPWLKSEMEQQGCKVFVPQFPSSSDIVTKVDYWFDVLRDYKQYIDEKTILIWHNLGGVFALRVLEKLGHPIQTAALVGTPRQSGYFDYVNAFSGFIFDWKKIKNNARHFVVFHSDNDPIVALVRVSRWLGMTMS